MDIKAVLMAVGVLFAGIKLWMDISSRAQKSNSSATWGSSVMTRNWFALLLCVAGTALMFAVLLWPLSALTVWLCAAGAVLVSMGAAAVLVMEALGGLSSRLLSR